MKQQLLDNIFEKQTDEDVDSDDDYVYMGIHQSILDLGMLPTFCEKELQIIYSSCTILVA